MKNKNNLIALALIVLSSALIIFILIPGFKDNQISKSKPNDFLPPSNQNFKPASQEIYFEPEMRVAREEFLKKNISSISPEKEVLGGKFYVTNISWIDADSALVEYEDGHIALKAKVIFERSLNVISFSVLEDEETEVKKSEARIFAPEAGALIASPLTVKGEAPGSWFFEATLRLRLVDDKGNIISSSWAQAGSDWMTENYVPYEGFLEFETEAEKGELLVLNDNPSGLPEYEVFVKIPVRFK